MRNQQPANVSQEVPAVEVRNVSKRFGVVQALDDVSLAVRRGGIHGVVGQNGAGKSTLMQILSGVYTPDDGDVLLAGKRVQMRNPEQARRLGVRIIYQELNLTPDQTIAENLFLGSEPRNRLGLVDHRRMRRDAKEALRLLGSSLSVDTKIGKINIGQQQLVEIAKALSTESQVLILDEPTAALEMQDIERLFDILARFREHGGTALYVSHRLSELFRICDRVTVMRDGKIIDTKPIGETRHSEIVEMMLGRPLDDIFPERRKGKAGKEALEARRLSSGVLREVSFSARAQSVLGIVGLEGSGIRELGRALVGDQRLTRGELVVAGRQRHFSQPAMAVRAGVVYLSADRKRDGLFSMLPLSENVTVGSLRSRQRAGVIDRRKERTFVDGSIRRLSIVTPSAAQEVRFLSGGNQQKVLLARWLGANPNVFVMDEPTRGIDVGSKAEIYSIMRELAEKGAAVIMISTDLTEVLGMSDEILVLHAGRVAAHLPGGVDERDVLPHVLGVEVEPK